MCPLDKGPVSIYEYAYLICRASAAASACTLVLLAGTFGTGRLQTVINMSPRSVDSGTFGAQCETGLGCMAIVV